MLCVIKMAPEALKQWVLPNLISVYIWYKLNLIQFANLTISNNFVMMSIVGHWFLFFLILSIGSPNVHVCHIIHFNKAILYSPRIKQPEYRHWFAVSCQYILSYFPFLCPNICFLAVSTYNYHFPTLHHVVCRMNDNVNHSWSNKHICIGTLYHYRELHVCPCEWIR